MNKFLGLEFGLMRADTCRPSSLNQAKLVTAIAAMIALSTTCADAANRHVGNASHFATHDFFSTVVVLDVSPLQSRCACRGSIYRLFSCPRRAAVPGARSGHQYPLRLAA